MFSRITPIFISGALVMTAILSLSWVSNSSANDLSGQSEDEIIPYVAIKSGADLEADTEQMREKQIPVLLFFSMEHCPFCNLVEEDYLKPMLRNADYANKVIIRKIKIDEGADVTDFTGKNRDAGEFSGEYNVSMVPTVVLVDANGKQLSPSIIGIANVHYYGGELDSAIDSSIHKIRAIAKY